MNITDEQIHELGKKFADKHGGPEYGLVLMAYKAGAKAVRDSEVVIKENSKYSCEPEEVIAEEMPVEEVLCKHCGLAPCKCEPNPNYIAHHPV